MQHNIVIVDDHILIAKALAVVINSFPDFAVLYEVEHGKAMIEKFNQRKNIPDIVLLDITMPVMDGFDTCKWLKKNHPDVTVIALSMQSDDMSLIRMIKAGVKGYLLKNIHPEDLKTALYELVKKGHYFPDWAASKVIFSLGEEKAERPEEIKFTDREYEFLKLSCTELSYKEIADKMFCSIRTVEGYRDALFDKLDLKTRVGLAVYAVKSRIYLT